MTNALNGLIVAELILCTVAVWADYWISGLRSYIYDYTNLILRIFLDEAVHCSIAILSWICILHCLNYKGLLTPIWTPVSASNKSYYDILLLFRDYILAGAVSLLLDSDHFISLNPLYIRSLNEATHLSHRSFGHSLQFLSVVVIVLISLYIVWCIFQQRRNTSRNNEDLIIDTKSSYNSYSTKILYIKYLTIVINSILVHQSRDAVRHGIYIAYLTPSRNDINDVYNTMQLWINNASWLGLHLNNGYISTVPLGQSYLYSCIVISIPILLSYWISILIYCLPNGVNISSQQANVVTSTKSIQEIV